MRRASVFLVLFILITMLVSCDPFAAQEQKKQKEKEEEYKRSHKEITFIFNDGVSEDTTYTMSLEKYYSESDKCYLYKGDYSWIYKEQKDKFQPVREGYTFDGWYTEEGQYINAHAETDNSDPQTLYARWVNVENAIKVGGTIYFVNTELGINNESHYSFYDKNGNKLGEDITDLSVLKNAAWYTIDEETRSIALTSYHYCDKYYVAFMVPIEAELIWETHPDGMGTYEGIGQGYTNTDLISLRGYKSDKYIWAYLRKFNQGYYENNTGLSDWYIGSYNEYKPITNDKSTGVFQTVFAGRVIWTSSEQTSRKDSVITYCSPYGGWLNTSFWTYGSKGVNGYVGEHNIVPIRSF